MGPIRSQISCCVFVVTQMHMCRIDANIHLRACYLIYAVIGLHTLLLLFSLLQLGEFIFP